MTKYMQEELKETIIVLREKLKFFNDKHCAGKTITEKSIWALEKQIPKKPIKGSCPDCEDIVKDICYDIPAVNFCLSCGQAIDWEGV